MTLFSLSVLSLACAASILAPAMAEKKDLKLRSHADRASIAALMQAATTYVEYRNANGALLSSTELAGKRASVMSAVAAANSKAHGWRANDVDTALSSEEEVGTSSTPSTHGTGLTTTTTGGWENDHIEFFATTDCSVTSELFKVVVTPPCNDITQNMRNLCQKLNIPAEYCPSASVAATCSGGYFKGMIYYSEGRNNGGNICGPNAGTIAIPPMQADKCNSLSITSNYTIGIAGQCGPAGRR
jgi:hypothetical protein